MSWRVEFTKSAAKELRALPKGVRARIRAAIEEKLLPDPRAHLLPLHGDRRGFCKFRVGSYRLLCRREDEVLLVLVVKLAHRREAYR